MATQDTQPGNLCVHSKQHLSRCNINESLSLFTLRQTWTESEMRQKIHFPSDVLSVWMGLKVVNLTNFTKTAKKLHVGPEFTVFMLTHETTISLKLNVSPPPEIVKLSNWIEERIPKVNLCYVNTSVQEQNPWYTTHTHFRS